MSRPPTRGVTAIVLAAGQGTRMRSARPKPLHLLCGRPMVRYVLDALADVAPERAIVVVGHNAARVTAKLSEGTAAVPVQFVEQTHQRGTGDAVGVALTAYDTATDDTDDVVVLPGDTPLLRPSTLAQLVRAHRDSGAAATLLTARVADPTGYGRVVRDDAEGVTGIIEHRDANPHQLAIDEINTSIYCFRRSLLTPALRRVRPGNAQGEWYLTDVVGVLVDAGHPVATVTLDDPSEAQGVNDRLQLATAEAMLRARTNEAWMRAGVTFVDPATAYVDTTVRLAADVTVFPGTILQGSTVISEHCEVGPDTTLVDTTVGERSVVTRTAATSGTIGDGATVGPYVVLGPGSKVASGEVVGPFTQRVSSAPVGAD